MNIYLDTEFEGLWENSKLISLGMISEDNKEIYVEFNDIDIDNQDDWIKQNVLVSTVYYGNQDVSNIVDENNYYVGNKIQIQGVLREWFRQFDDVQIVSDVSHYDFVKLIDIFGTAFDLPENVGASCHDINQDIASALNISEKEAFNYNREELLSHADVDLIECKHNSLYDAKVIKCIYNQIQQINLN